MLTHRKLDDEFKCAVNEKIGCSWQARKESCGDTCLRKQPFCIGKDCLPVAKGYCQPDGTCGKIEEPKCDEPEPPTAAPVASPVASPVAAPTPAGFECGKCVFSKKHISDVAATFIAEAEAVSPREVLLSSKLDNENERDSMAIEHPTLVSGVRTVDCRRPASR